MFFIIGTTGLNPIFAQENESDSTLFSGVVFSSENLTNPLSKVSILVNSKSSTSSNDNGEFSVDVVANDTLKFTHIGYHPTTVVVPDSVKGGKLIARIFLINDTVDIQQVVVKSMQDYTAFKSSFIEMESDKDLTNAKNNIEMSLHKAKTTTDWTVEDNLERTLERQANRSKYYGQLPPENTINFITVAGGLFELIKKDKEKTKNKRYYRELVNLQNQNNLVYLKK